MEGVLQMDTGGIDMLERNRIYNMDVLEGLRALPDDSVDLIVTSPPYNKGYWSVNRRTNITKGSFYTKSRRIDYGVFDDRMDPDEYVSWQKQILDECIRVIKPTGSIFYNHCEIQRDCLAIHPTYVYDYPIKQLIIWDKGSTPRLDKSYFYPTTEFIYWIKKTKKARPYFDRRNAIFNRAVWCFPPDRHNTHPAPFPQALPENCILACTKPGDLVLDPFMGSGTTARAAKLHGRDYIGFELNPEYIQEI